MSNKITGFRGVREPVYHVEERRLVGPMAYRCERVIATTERDEALLVFDALRLIGGAPMYAPTAGFRLVLRVVTAR